MVNSHICTDSCFSSRIAEKNAVNCFWCDKKCSAKCFDVAPQSTVKMQVTGSNTVLVCNKCMEKLVKMKSNARKSTDRVESTRKNTIEDTPTQQDEVKNMLMDMMTTMNWIKDEFVNFNECNEEYRLSSATNKTQARNSTDSEMAAIKKSLLELHAKFDHQGTSSSSSQSESKMISQINKKVEAIYDRLGTPQPTHVTWAGTKNGNYLTNGNKSKKSYTTDPLNRSFSFNQSMFPNDNVELYHLLHGFEQNTWASFDYLRHKMDENADTISSIETITNKIHSDREHQRLQSPSVESINIDQLQIISEKCETIEKSVKALEQNISELSTQRQVACETEFPHISTGRRTQNVSPSETKLGHEIYIAKFPTITSCEDIKAYIDKKELVDESKIRIHHITAHIHLIQN